ncbi:MAG: alpha/beta hydrolase [Patescibacteria group bacterium]
MYAKLIKRLVVIIAGTYLAVGLFLFFFQNSYIYFPDSRDFAACSDFADSDKLNMDGTRAYFKHRSEKLVVFYHGNAGSACDRAWWKPVFENLNYSHLFVEYAGYSGDARTPNKKLILQDVENVNKFLQSRQYSRLALMGESIGAAVAVYHSSIADEDQLVLIAPFDSMVNVAKKHYPFFPASLLLRENYDTRRWATDLKSVLIVHGERDSIIPLALGRNLFEKIGIADKTFVAIPGADHNDLYDFPETLQAIIKALK